MIRHFFTHTSYTHTTFLAQLELLGYAPPAPIGEQVCEHSCAPLWTFYTMPLVVLLKDAQPSSRPMRYGDVGWFVYHGCEDCTMEVGGNIFCGGLYEQARMFCGEREVTETTGFGKDGMGQLLRADAMLPDEMFL